MTIKSLYEKYLKDNPNTYCTQEQWLEFMSKQSKNIDPIISDDFQIGPDGAFEYQDDETTWDDILNEIEINLHAEIPIRVKNWLKNTFESPKYKK